MKKEKLDNKWKRRLRRKKEITNEKGDNEWKGDDEGKRG
jgi:hypothetical protein